MRFLIDAQLPPRLTRMLRRAGHEAEHVFDLGLVAKPDIEIWHYAGETGAVILTKDADFATMRMHAANGPVVVWVRLGNTTTVTIISALTSALPDITTAIDAGEVLVEVV